MKNHLDKEWAIGRADNGHENYVYGVIVPDENNATIVAGISQELAQCIVADHNLKPLSVRMKEAGFGEPHPFNVKCYETELERLLAIANTPHRLATRVPEKVAGA